MNVAPEQSIGGELSSRVKGPIFCFPGVGNDSVGNDEGPATPSGKHSPLSLPVWRDRLSSAPPWLQDQMRTVAIGIVAFERLSRGGIEPAVITSHSLGIYAALSASGAITPGAALDAAWRAGELLREHQDESLGALLAVVGLSLDQVEEIVRNVGGSLRIAARNTGSQFVLGGEIDDLDRAEEEASEALQVERIDAGGALHTDRMDAIVPKFAEFVEQMEVRDPARPYLSHRGAAYLTSSAEVREALAGQLRDPVLWSDCLLKLGREGAWLFVDMGPGSMLKKSIRWVLRSARALSLAEGDTPEDVAAALREAEGMEGASES